MKRRHVLGLTATSIASLAGCSSLSNGGSESTEQTTTASSTATETASSTATSEGTSGSTDQAKTGKRYPIETANGAVAKAPVDGNPSAVTYAITGHSGTETTATFYGNWKCPYTQEFVLNGFPRIVSDYVEPGKLNVQFRAVAYQDDEGFLGPDAPRASRAGLAVWNHAPQDYWKYFATSFESQPREKYDWATTDQLMRLVDAAGVSNKEKIRSEIESDTYEPAMKNTVRDYERADIEMVPRIVVDGTVTAPTQDFDRTISVIEDAIDGA